MSKTAAKKTDSKKTILSLRERIAMSGIFPAQGDYSFFIVKKDILKKVGISQEELKKYGIKTIESEKGSLLTWSAVGEKAKFSYEFSDLEENEIKLCLTKLNEEKKLSEDLIGLYEAFVK